MAKITYDVSGEDPEKNSTVKIYKTPPVGLYPAKIVSAVAENPPDKNPRIVVKVEITKPAKNDYGRLTEYVTLTEASAWKLDQLLLATGLVTKTAKRKGSFEDKQLVNKNIQIYVTHETSSYVPEGKTEPVTTVRARIGNFLAKNATIEGLSPGKADVAEDEEPSEDEEPDLEALGEAADADDADAIATLTEMAAEYEIDPEEIESWAEVATAIQEAKESVEEKEEENISEEEDSEDDLDALAEAADGDDEEDADLQAAQARLTELAEPLSLDPDEYETWADLAIAITEAGEKTEEEEEAPDYEAMSTLALKKLAKEREIASSGTKAEIIERLQEFDNTDPFKS